MSGSSKYQKEFEDEPYSPNSPVYSPSPQPRKMEREQVSAPSRTLEKDIDFLFRKLDAIQHQLTVLTFQNENRRWGKGKGSRRGPWRG